MGRNWFWAVVLAGGLLLYRTMFPDVELPDSGPPAPTFTLPTLKGDTLNLDALRGDVVVVNIWATWCRPCRLEKPGFIELQDEFRDQGVTFVGLSTDTDGLDAVRPYAQERGLNYPQVADGRVAYDRFGQSTAVPRTFVIDRQGQIRFQHTGMLLKGALRPVLEELAAEPAS